VKTTERRTCPVCNTLFDGSSEFCPVCALKSALPSETRITASELRFEHYQILKNDDASLMELGHGAMGVTYKALDVQLQRPVALKIINAKFIGDASARQRFVREARAAASVRHPNVATVYHLGEIGGDYFYAMEFVEGETLEKIIRHAGRLRADLALEITAQVATGLDAIYEQHLVHRDVKPGNIMVSLRERELKTVKIIDLGLAKAVAEEGSISASGSFVGTPGYASPEQFAGVGVDIRSDLYSMGIVLWEMLAGSLPFQGTSSELVYQHQHTSLPIESLDRVPQQVVPLLEILLEKDPASRSQTPSGFLKALAIVNDAIESGHQLTQNELRTKAAGAVLQKGPAVLSTAQRNERRRLLAWLALIPGVAVLLIATFLFFNRARRDTVVLAEKGVAVLPFDNLSANKDDAYFADGVQDEILNNLAKIAQLKVISRTSVMQYRGDNKRDLRKIASALGVANVLEGTVRRDGKHVRVSTELVDARSDNTIWADSYDRDLTNIFAIQSEIAQTVASRLSAQLSPEERKDIEEKPTNNLEAYDLYLQAKQLLGPNSVVLWNSEMATFSKAISLLEESTHKDRNFALAYCMIAKAHDYLYFDQVDRTPERRTLGDAAVNEALRLRPDLAEVHLSAAFHLYACYRDFERARVQIAIASQTLPNNPDLLELTALIDRVRGRWEKATVALERAATLDPRNPKLLTTLADTYRCLRRYRDCERIWDRLLDLEPDQPVFTLYKAESVFAEKGDLKGIRAAYKALPTSMKDDVYITWERVYYAMCARDFPAAAEIVSKSPNQEIRFFGPLVPRGIVALWLELVQGNHPTIEEFGAARERLYRKVEADRTDPFMLAALALADVALGRKEESIQEGRRAMEMRPISEDAEDGPVIAVNVAAVYAWANESDFALEQLKILMKMPDYHLNYGDLKTNPSWNPIREDPRFDKLLAELAPKN
jgi:serine/threonine protein kinase/Flp pilus assembly protein TadD